MNNTIYISLIVENMDWDTSQETKHSCLIALRTKKDIVEMFQALSDIKYESMGYSSVANKNFEIIATTNDYSKWIFTDNLRLSLTEWKVYNDEFNSDEEAILYFKLIEE